MAQYQVWVENDAYAKQALITRYLKLTYTQVLNDIGYCQLEMHPDDPKITELTEMRRLKIIRDGEIVWGGIILRTEWKIPETAPEGETFVAYALDHTVYADWRLIVPPSGSAYDTRSGPADDVAKAYVYYHAGAGAAAGRQFTDLSVQANASACANVREEGRYIILLSMLQKLRVKGGFDFRFVPLANGCEFRTAYPRWGVDRTKGNGVNDECVFAIDRRNFSEMTYALDLLAHYNYWYVGGQGEGEDRAIVERSDAGYIASYKRRERFRDARRLQLTASLEAEGDEAIEEARPLETMTVQPKSGIWKATSGTTYDLGDLVTCYAHRWGRTFSLNAKITAVKVEVTPDELEIVTPTLEAV
jgi:hypothetical protein